jgi:Kef-type K+ transport system membrane component KefB
MNDPMLQLLLQIGVIIFVSRLLASLLRVLGQPQVVGEMLAGIALGPSVLGLMYHGVWMRMLFPHAPGPDPFPYLNMLAQLGVMFFMFLVGLEFDINMLRGQGKAVLVTGVTSLLAPLLGGFILAGFLYHAFHGSAGGFAVFVLFGGVAMCITAFPVLARIITEHNLQKTSIGGIALACAAFNDAAGWCLLALVLAVASAAGLGQHRPPHPLLHASMTAVWSVVFAAFVFTIMRPALRGLQNLYTTRGYLSQTVMAGIFMLIVACSFITQWIGIQAIFGAFLLGAAMPAEGKFVRHISEKIQDFALLFLLPVFFAYTGLRTQIGLLNSPRLWEICGVIIFTATITKFAGSALAARFAGLRWRQAGVLGSLMNARGLVELIVLNIGLSLHVLSPAMFTLMVVMALVTTFITTPLMYAIYPPAKLRRDEGVDSVPAAPDHQHVLVAVSSPLSARSLLNAGALLLGGEKRQIYALHLETPEESESRRGKIGNGPDPLTLMQRRAINLGLTIEVSHHVSRSIADDICMIARRCNADWIVMGGHRGVLSPSSVAGVAQQVLDNAPGNIAILIDKGLDDVKRVLVPYLGEPQDAGALLAADAIGRLPSIQITILHIVDPRRTQSQSPLGVESLVDQYMPAASSSQRVRMIVIQSNSPADEVVNISSDFDLIVLGIAPQWKLKRGILGRSQMSVAERSACSLLIAQASGVRPGHLQAGQAPAIRRDVPRPV